MEFEEFMKSNEAGRFIINPFWLEHLLNLFYQGYLDKVWEEVQDTIMNQIGSIENISYGIIGREFDKKHVNLKEMQDGSLQ